MLSHFHILTMTHKEVSLDKLPAYAIACENEDDLRGQLQALKQRMQLDELFYINTCNRVMFFFLTMKEVDQDFISAFAGKQVRPWLHYHGASALLHLFQVAASIHSMVVGERQILRQIRDAYDQQSQWGLSGDYVRLSVEQMIRSAKKVYASTSIGDRLVSVVSLAVKRLQDFKLRKDAKFVLVGAGSTIQLVLKHLTKRGYHNFTIYNRTLAKAEKIGKPMGAQVGTLDQLSEHKEHFDCLIACTGSHSPIIRYDLAKQITQDQMHDKIWVDLGVPPDISARLQQDFDDHFIGVQSLKALAVENMKLRQKEIEKADIILDEAVETFLKLIYQRRVELAFQVIPEEIKEIKQKAMDEVFRKDLEVMDDHALDVVSKMMDYMEKKCIGIPMKAAKEAAHAAVSIQ